MKKNVDQMTADLYNAIKAAYLREFSGIIRNNTKCQPVTVDMMAQIANGCSVDGITLAVGTDRKKVIDLMPGYSCGLSSLPRIYKQVARMAGEPCEKITVGVAALNAYGLTDEQLKAKENKKIIATLKKFCPAPKKNDSREMKPYTMGVYHDKIRRCAVWTNSHILVVVPWLYNDAVAGHIVTADGRKITDLEGQPAIYPNWSYAVPDMSYKTAKKEKFNVYSINAATVAANAATVAATVKGVKNAKEYFVAARYASGGGVAAFTHAFAPWFSLVDGDLYFKNNFTAAVGYIHTAGANGFIVFMPMMLEGGTPETQQKEIDRYADNKTIYADTENDVYIKNQLPQAAAASLPLPFLAVCPEVSTPAEPVADAAAEVVETPAETVADAVADVVEAPAETVADAVADVVEAPAESVADAAADVVEAPAEPVADAAAEVVKVPAADVAEAPAADEPHPDAIGEIVTIPANQKNTFNDAVILAQAARIKSNYEAMKQQAAADAFADAITAYCAALEEPAAPAWAPEIITVTPCPTWDDTPAADAAPAPRRRRFAPRLRPVLRRLGRVAAVVLPLLIVALFIGASTDSTASTPAADASTVTTCQAAEPVAQVVELPAVTVTASRITTAPATPSPIKKLAAPSPVKKAAADAVTLPGQKTASALATATAPAANDADSITTAPAAPLAPAADADGLTICAGTAWTYTMMNWA